MLIITGLNGSRNLLRILKPTAISKAALSRLPDGLVNKSSDKRQVFNKVRKPLDYNKATLSAAV